MKAIKFIQFIYYIGIITFSLTVVFPAKAKAQLNPNNTALKVNAYQQYKAYNKALELINNLTFSELKDSTFYSYAKAKILIHNQEIEQANAILLSLNKSNPKLANYELAQCYGYLNKPNLALSYLEVHLNSNQKKLISEIKSDQAFQSIQNSKEWVAFWNKDWYTKSELLFTDADYEFRLGNYEESLVILDLVLAKRKSMHTAHQLKALIFVEEKDYENALYEMQQAVKIKPKIATYHYKKALYEFELNKVNKANKSLSIALEQDSNQVDFYTLQAQILMAFKKIELATTSIELVNELIDSEHSKYIGAQICFEAGDYLSSLKYLNACIKGSNSKTAYYLLRAKNYYESGIYQYAEKDFSFLLDYSPTNGELFSNRGLCRQKQGNLKGACSDWHKARSYGFIKVDEYLEKYCY